MNIAIIEKGHFEVAYTLISLFDRNDNRITIFIDNHSYQQLKYLLKDRIHKYTWLIQEEQSNRDFIRHLFQHIRTHSFDLLYFNTISDNFILYAWHVKRLENERIVLTLHDMLGYFQFKPTPVIRKILRQIGKRRLLYAIQNFNVISETLAPLLKEKLPASKKVFTIPGGFFEPEKFIRSRYNGEEAIKITVPGSIDSRRRNYTSVFELLEIAQSMHLNISITLLGSFRKKYSEEIYERCKKWKRSSANLHIYESGDVDQAEFDRVMTESHFVWVPVQQFAVVTDGVTEEYGVSINTGNIGDIIRHARPFFAPAYFNFDNALFKSRIAYTNVIEIANYIQQLNSALYTELQENALRASGYYTKEKIIERNKELFQ